MGEREARRRQVCAQERAGWGKRGGGQDTRALFQAGQVSLPGNGSWEKWQALDNSTLAPVGMKCISRFGGRSNFEN